MKKFLFFTAVVALFSTGTGWAQTPTFTVPHDTVNYSFNSAGSGLSNDNITNITGTNINMQWRVISTNFPSSWLTPVAFGICDNLNCFNNSEDTLWNSGSSFGPAHFSTYYANTAHDSLGGFSLSLNFDSSVSGCHYVTIQLKDLTSGYTDTVTFNNCFSNLAVTTIQTQNESVLLYPNPANSDINIVYDASADVRTVAIYNIIGKSMKAFKVSGNSANLNIEDLPSGIYLVRLYNSQGGTVSTRKFTKQ